MNAPSSSSSGSPTTDGGSAALFEQWAIYRKIIEHNCMGHDEISSVIRARLVNRSAIRRFLDLGCGDAELPSCYLAGLGVAEYHGVDLAMEPLEFARGKLEGVVAAIHLHHADQAAFVASTELRFDVIALGFALHHSPAGEKAALLRHARRRLESGGELLLHDVFRNSGEDLDTYFQRYVSWIRTEWSGMTPRELDLVEEHIRRNDHPDSIDDLMALGRDAGFSKVEELLSTCRGFHRLLHFRA